MTSSVRTWRTRPELARPNVPAGAGGRDVVEVADEIVVFIVIPSPVRCHQTVLLVQFDDDPIENSFPVLAARVGHRDTVDGGDPPGFVDVAVKSDERAVVGDGVAHRSAPDRDHVGPAGVEYHPKVAVQLRCV